MNSILKSSVLIITVILQVFISPLASAGWSNENKQNFCHFLNSQREDGRATNISNSAGGYATQGQIDQLLNYWRRALNEASQVTDSVLDKTHPELKERYKNQYIRGLQYQIAAFEQQNAQYSITGSKLKSDYVDWFSSERRKFKVPKGTVSACR